MYQSILKFIQVYLLVQTSRNLIVFWTQGQLLHGLCHGFAWVARRVPRNSTRDNRRHTGFIMSYTIFIMELEMYMGSILLIKCVWLHFSALMDFRLLAWATLRIYRLLELMASLVSHLPEKRPQDLISLKRKWKTQALFNNPYSLFL